MTVLFSIAHPHLITITVDSAVTRIYNYGEFREYLTEQKAYQFPGVGVVGTWGSRDGNNIGSFLSKHNIHSSTHNIDSLANIVSKYLVEEYRPHERNADDIGYHVVGFDKNHEPCLYHIYYGFERPRNVEQISREYRSGKYHAGALLYNGRNDLIESTIHLFLSQIQAGYSTRFDLTNLDDLVLLSDFTVRFSAEITPEVGPPFSVYMLNQRNEVSVLQNHQFCRLDRHLVQEKLKELLKL